MAAEYVDKDALDVEDTDNDIDSGDDHVKYEISNYPSDMSLAEYKRKWDKKDLEIPDFQRNYVWSRTLRRTA